MIVFLKGHGSKWLILFIPQQWLGFHEPVRASHDDIIPLGLETPYMNMNHHHTEHKSGNYARNPCEPVVIVATTSYSIKELSQAS